MKFPAKGGKDFEKVPAGTHVAVCNLIADVGLQPGSAQFPNPVPKVFFRFEVPSERATYTKDDKELEGPMTIYANFRASMNGKANLRKMIESWAGRKFTDQEAEQFDIAKVLGKACMILVTHTDDGKYANIDNIMALPKGTKAPAAENPLILYDTEHDSTYEQLPKFLKEKVDNQLDPSANAKSNERKSADDAFADGEAQRQAEKDGGAFVDDDISDIR